MGRQLTLELPDELYEPLAKSAEVVGQTLDEWIITRLRPLAQRPVLSEKEKKVGNWTAQNVYLLDCNETPSI